MIDISSLISEAKKHVGEFALSTTWMTAGSVSAAVLSATGKIYTGICIDVACGIGFCAEHSAIADMLKHRETRIDMVVAVKDDGKVIPPCGRCRELMLQINAKNENTGVVLDNNRIVLLKDLLPFRWV